MEIALFGATGRTGLPLVRQALERGHSVSALVRTPSKMEHGDKNLTLIRGDVYTYTDEIQRTVDGTDAVISVLGRTKSSPDDLLEKGIENILSAMKNTGVKRLIFLTGAGVRFPKDKPKGIDKFITFLLKVFAGKVLADSKAAVEKIRASNTDWTVVRAPMLTEGQKTDSYRVGYAGVGTGPKASRENVAQFILSVLENGSYIHDGPVVSDPE